MAQSREIPDEPQTPQIQRVRQQQQPFAKVHLHIYNVEKNLESCSFCMQQHIAVPVYSQGKNVPAGLPL